METYEDALEWLSTAQRYSAEGFHTQARDCFRRAAVIFADLGVAGLAGFCWRQHQVELEAAHDGGPIGTARYTIR